MSDKTKLTRRGFFKMSGAAAATMADGTGALAPANAHAATPSLGTHVKASLPKAKGHVWWWGGYLGFDHRQMRQESLPQV